MRFFCFWRILQYAESQISYGSEQNERDKNAGDKSRKPGSNMLSDLKLESDGIFGDEFSKKFVHGNRYDSTVLL